MLANMIGMCYLDSYSNKGPRRVPKETGIEWVMRTLGNPTDCYDMFRMSRPMFEKLHNVLVESYGLHSTRRMSSTESLALFLWTVGALNQLGSKEIDLSDIWRHVIESLRKCWHV